MSGAEGVNVVGRFVGVGISTYLDPKLGVLAAVEEVKRVGDLLAAKGFVVDTLVDVSDGEAEDGLTRLLPVAGLAGGVLVVLWAGHGERSAASELRLLTTSSVSGAPAKRLPWRTCAPS